jgi:hypothetical protein
MPSTRQARSVSPSGGSILSTSAPASASTFGGDVAGDEAGQVHHAQPVQGAAGGGVELPLGQDLAHSRRMLAACATSR